MNRARRRPQITIALVASCVTLAGLTAHGQPAQPPLAASQPATASASQASDPFDALRVVTPKEQLGAVRAIRVRDKREAPSGDIRVAVRSSPSGASVTHGGKALGNTPLTLTAPAGSTPLDLVIRSRGKMTVRTRVMRRRSRSYFFKLNPAKL